MKKYYYLVAASMLLLAGCSNEKINWQNAKKQNDVQTYEQFLKNYPQSLYNDSANYFIEKIAFDKAYVDNSLKSYLELIKKYPDNRFLKKLSKTGDEFIIDSLTNDYVKNTELTIKKSSENKTKSKWIVPPHAKFNVGGLICEAGPEGYSVEKEIPDSSLVELNAETVTVEKDLVVYISKNIILLSGTNGSKFKRLPDKKISLSQGVIYKITLK